MRTFRSILPYTLPAFVRDDEAGGAFAWILAAFIDVQLERTKQGVAQRYPTHAGKAALDLIGRYRLLPRGRGESDDSYAARLRAWRYPRGHRVRGNCFALLDQISTYFGGGLALYGIDRNGNKRARSALGVETYSYGNTWIWDAGAAAQWARQWLVVNGAGHFSEQIAWGTPLLWGGVISSTDHCLGMVGASPGDWRAICGLMTGPHRWLPAGMQGEWIVVMLDGSVPVPDTDYATWGKLSGADYVPSRDVNGRYVAVRPALLEYAGDAVWANQSVTDLGTFDGDDTDFPLTITLPDGSTYAGDSGEYPATVTLFDDASPPGDIAPPFRDLADRTAVLVPDVQTFTSNGTWTKPANAVYCDMVLVGPGGSGSNVAASGGGGGGGSGSVYRCGFPASHLPASLSATVPAHTSATDTTVTGAGVSIRADYGISGGAITGGAGGTYGDTGGVGGAQYFAGSAGVPNAQRRGGGSVGAGGASGGTGGVGGSPGYGYGAGGGGGGGKGTGGGGGGGGGGGYGTAAIASSGTDGTPAAGGLGGDGAGGLVVITTWKGVSVI